MNDFLRFLVFLRDNFTHPSERFILSPAEIKEIKEMAVSSKIRCHEKQGGHYALCAIL